MPRLSLDLRTDYIPGEDFVWVEITMYFRPDPQHNHHALLDVTGQDPAGGVRVVDLPNVRHGDHRIAVRLLDAHGRGVAMRMVDLRLRDDFAMTLIVSRPD